MKTPKNTAKRSTDKSEKSREKHFQRLGTRKPICSTCEESEPSALTGYAPDIVCYECQAKAHKKSLVESHHPSGRQNDSFTIPIPGNDHRVLTEKQRDWPIETLRNPNGSPLRKASAAIRGWLDTLRLMIERILGWIPDFLERLDELLTAQLGGQWWVKIGLDREAEK